MITGLCFRALQCSPSLPRVRCRNWFREGNGIGYETRCFLRVCAPRDGVLHYNGTLYSRRVHVIIIRPCCGRLSRPPRLPRRRHCRHRRRRASAAFTATASNAAASAVATANGLTFV